MADFISGTSGTSSVSNNVITSLTFSDSMSVAITTSIIQNLIFSNNITRASSATASVLAPLNFSSYITAGIA